MHGKSPENATLIMPAFHGRESGVKWIAFGVALVFHVAALFVQLPEFQKRMTPTKENRIIVVRKYIPPPPKIERPPARAQKKKLTRSLPIPDPTPDEPEPIREPEPEIPIESYPDDVEFVLGVPEAPPVVSSGPVMAGVGGVTDPVRLEDSYVSPQYPELARVARVEGNVILQAVIHCDGSVGELRVLRCSQPGFGFEDNAVTAVHKWRYSPATQDGRPVDVYFTVFVEFALL